MEASALQAPGALSQTKVALATPLLRFRSDEQLVALFRAGCDDAFRVIHERYNKRLFAYTRQMLPGRQDAEDALQDVFIRAYSGLRASDRQLALRAWLFRVAHNRCIDELRRPAPPPPEVLQLVRSTTSDPLAEVDLRESMRRLIEDIRRLPEQQRSALLMRELGGVAYADLAASLGISVGAVKSLLVRARIGLAQATAARDTACGVIREQLVEAHDRGMRPDANVRRHMRDCTGCKSFRRELRGVSRQLAAVAPAVGPLGLVAKVLGFSGGGGAGGGAALLGGGGAAASAGGLAVGVNHVATLIVAAVATAGGAVGIQHTIIASAHHPAHHRRPAGATTHSPRHQQFLPSAGYKEAADIQDIATAVEASVSATPAAPAAGASAIPQPKPHKSADRDPASKRLGSDKPSTKRTATLAPAAGETTGTSTTGGTTCSSVSTTSSSTAPGPASTTSTTASTSATSTPSSAQPTTCTANPVASTPATTSSTTTSGSAGTSPSTTAGSGPSSTSSTPPTTGSTTPAGSAESGSSAPVG